MQVAGKWPRILVIVGFVLMLIGILDPLEGSLVILPGTGLVALGALLRNSPSRILISWAFWLVLFGIGAMWGLSAIGGIGGETGRSHWWGLTILPYPIGWIMGFVGAIRIFREHSRYVRPHAVQ